MSLPKDELALLRRGAEGRGIDPRGLPESVLIRSLIGRGLVRLAPVETDLVAFILTPAGADVLLEADRAERQ